MTSSLRERAHPIDQTIPGVLGSAGRRCNLYQHVRRVGADCCDPMKIFRQAPVLHTSPAGAGGLRPLLSSSLLKPLVKPRYLWFNGWV
jgi:hypothetical protein